MWVEEAFFPHVAMLRMFAALIIIFVGLVPVLVVGVFMMLSISRLLLTRDLMKLLITIFSTLSLMVVSSFLFSVHKIIMEIWDKSKLEWLKCSFHGYGKCLNIKEFQLILQKNNPDILLVAYHCLSVPSHLLLTQTLQQQLPHHWLAFQVDFNLATMQ